MISTIEYLMAVGALAGHIVIGIILLAFIISPKKTFAVLKKYIAPYAYILIFLSTLAAMLGSLFFSEIAKIPPCDLCWYQRIFMYPQPFLLYIAMLRKEKITPYILFLNIGGLAIAVYQYLMQLFPNTIPAPCKAGGISCITGYTFYFGYISIPMMALTVFLCNILLILLHTRKST